MLDIFLLELQTNWELGMEQHDDFFSLDIFLLELLTSWELVIEQQDDIFSELFRTWKIE